LLVLTLRLDGNADARTKPRSVIAANLFIADNRKSVGHAGNFLVAVILGKNDLHLDGSRDFGALLALGLFLSAQPDHWLAKCAEQNQIEQFLHGISSWAMRTVSKPNCFCGSHCDFSSAKSLTSSSSIWIGATCRGVKVVASNS